MSLQQSEKFYRLLDAMKYMHNAKRHDYGGEEDAFLNFRTCEWGGIPAWKGSLH